METKSHIPQEKLNLMLQTRQPLMITHHSHLLSLKSRLLKENFDLSIPMHVRQTSKHEVRWAKIYINKNSTIPYSLFIVNLETYD